MDCSLPGSSVHGISQARILEWAVISSRGSSWPRDGTQVSQIAGRFFTIWATRKPTFHLTYYSSLFFFLKSLSLVWLFATPWTIQSMEFSRPEYWSGWPFPSPGDLTNPGIEPRSPPLQADSLPAKPQGKPNNTGEGSLSPRQQIVGPRNPTGVSCVAGGFFTNWAIREACIICLT